MILEFNKNTFDYIRIVNLLDDDTLMFDLRKEGIAFIDIESSTGFIYKNYFEIEFTDKVFDVKMESGKTSFKVLVKMENVTKFKINAKKAIFRGEVNLSGIRGIIMDVFNDNTLPKDISDESLVNTMMYVNGNVYIPRFVSSNNTELEIFVEDTIVDLSKYDFQNKDIVMVYSNKDFYYENIPDNYELYNNGSTESSMEFHIMPNINEFNNRISFAINRNLSQSGSKLYLKRKELC